MLITDWIYADTRAEIRKEREAVLGSLFLKSDGSSAPIVGVGGIVDAGRGCILPTSLDVCDHGCRWALVITYFD